MYRFWLLAGAAGLVSAVVFLIGVSGSQSGIMLAYLAPAPIFAAALALGGAAGVAAAVLGTVPVLVADMPAGLTYAVVAAAPAAVLGHMAMLSRTDEQGTVEWYPSGKLTSWLCCVGLVVFTVICGLLARGQAGLAGSAAGMTVELADWLEVKEMDLFLSLFQPVLPGVAAASWILLLAVNGVLAQGLLTTVNRAGRPSPDFGALKLPRWMAVLGAVAALAAILLSGDYAYFARNMLLVLAVPFFLQGLSVVHVLARKIGGDNMVLAMFYVTLLVVGWAIVPLILVVLLGLIEQAAGLRQRMTKQNQT